MSLGWQCESALLPSKSKPINNVDTKSLIGLKSFIYNNQVNNNTTISDRYKVKRTIDEQNNLRSIKKFKETDTDKIIENSDTTYQALNTKAKLYDEIKQGKLNIKSDVLDLNVKIKKNDTLITTINEDKSDCNFNQVQVNNNKWNWSTTSSDIHLDSCNIQYINEKQEELKLKKLISERFLNDLSANKVISNTNCNNPEIDSNLHSNTVTTVCNESKIKTQWDKVLNANYKNELEFIHEETKIKRNMQLNDNSSSYDNDSYEIKVNNTSINNLDNGDRNLTLSKEKRLELIRQKRLMNKNKG